MTSKAVRVRWLLTAVLSGALGIAARLLRGRAARARLGGLADLTGRPQGISGVTNPLPAEGGADPEAREQARSQVPSAVHTFDRAASLSDFEAIALAMPGVARAVATRRADAHQTTVVVAVEGHQGVRLGSEDLREIQSELDRHRDPAVRVEVVDYVEMP
jgi:hypothetical protein